jgi:hypothetical protein
MFALMTARLRQFDMHIVIQNVRIQPTRVVAELDVKFLWV